MIRYPLDLYWLWFSLLPRIGYKRGKFILGNYKSPEELWNKQSNIIGILEEKDEKIFQTIMDDTYRDKSLILFKKLCSDNIKVCSIFDSEYPPLLKEIYDPPIVLFYKGDIRKCTNAIAIIGSRKATSYGLQASDKISSELASYGYCIVSGMARGIDSKAHKSAIMAGGTTCAVIGCGNDIVYPPENNKLMKEIEDKGVVISEFPPETLPASTNFPARNRIISGVSKGIVVIEAGQRSGSLITVDFALEQGRDVYSVPGNIFSANSIGSNNLIKDGAKLVQSAADIISEYGDIKTHEILHHNKQSDVEYNITNGIQIDIVEAIKTGYSTLNEIVNEIGKDVNIVMSELMLLELYGILIKHENGEYEIINSKAF